jgi:hypothetical protein
VVRYQGAKGFARITGMLFISGPTILNSCLP